MEFIVLILLATFAMSSAEECSGVKTEACMQNLLETILNTDYHGEICRALKSTTTCLEKIADDCGEVKELEGNFAELKKVLKDECEENSNSDEIDESLSELQECLETHFEYIYQCIYEASTQTLELLAERGEEDNENALQCTIYTKMYGCTLERTKEKCGVEAAKLKKKQMDEELRPKYIEACEAAGGIDQLSFELLDRRKK